MRCGGHHVAFYHLAVHRLNVIKVTVILQCYGHALQRIPSSKQESAVVGCEHITAATGLVQCNRLGLITAQHGVADCHLAPAQVHHIDLIGNHIVPVIFFTGLKHPAVWRTSHEQRMSKSVGTYAVAILLPAVIPGGNNGLVAYIVC